MTAELRRGVFLAVLGLLLGLGLVAALFEGGGAWKREAAPASGADVATSVLSPDAGKVGTPPETSDAPKPAPPAARTDAPAADPNALTFDIVRVEPNGESVVAGRGAPNTVVELLVDGKAVARALADPNGQFAIVPPALKAGDSEIVLRSTDAAGRETRSKDSVAVAVSASRTEKPLVALTSPDKATVVLSQPDAPAPTAKRPPDGTAGRQAARGGEAADRNGPDRNGPGRDAAGREAVKPAPKEPPAPVKIVSVDAQEGGRLFVTSQAPPGATVRLYLNDTLIAPASVGKDGKVTFTIGRGVNPGAYTVRIDQVDSVSGKVRGRAEVPFTVPEPARVAAVADPAGKPAERPGTKPPAPSVGTATPAALDPPRAAGTPVGVFVPEVNTAKIVRGDSLWQISRRTYGAGDRYTVIYDANHEQIRNPDLIYPGQIFVLPGEGGKEALKAGRRG